MGVFSDLPPAGPVARLVVGDLDLAVMPSCGARVVSLRLSERDVLRPALPCALDTAYVYGFAAFPLMPYSGPIFGGGFSFGGRFHSLARNVPTEPSATHGEAWISAWRIESSQPDRLSLVFDYEPGPDRFPFPWRGRIEYALDGAAFLTRMTLANTGRTPMPAGMGMHPYFPVVPGATLAFGHGDVWPPDSPEAVCLGPAAPPPGLDFRNGQEILGRGLDRCFDDWDGRAVLTMPDGSATTVEADPVFGKLQLYDAWDYPYICIEPVTNANDGYNRMARGVAGHAVRTLAPEEEMHGWIRVTASFPAVGREPKEET